MLGNVTQQLGCVGCLFCWGRRSLYSQGEHPRRATIEGDSAVFLQEQNTIEYVGNVIAFMDGASWRSNIGRDDCR